jgi:hypothetical protein
MIGEKAVFFLVMLSLFEDTRLGGLSKANALIEPYPAKESILNCGESSERVPNPIAKN